jgi:hypothetical protein
MPTFEHIEPEHKDEMVLAVAETAKALFKILPEWPKSIDWVRFNFADYVCCVRGQLEKLYPSAYLAEIATLGGFNVPRHIQKKYATGNILTLWEFMGAEWKKYQDCVA